MAPFLVNHPSLLHSWIMAKELILAEVLNFKNINNSQNNRFFELLKRANNHINEWDVEDKIQSKRIKILQNEINSLRYLLSLHPTTLME